MFTDEQIERYARHILLREVGGQGQRRLLEAKVEVEGLTAPAVWAAHYLALGGVGSLLLHDLRPCPPEGLPPLVPAGTEGRRAEAAVATLAAFNPDVVVEAARTEPGKQEGAERPTPSEPWSRWTIGEGPRLWLLAKGRLGFLGWGEGPPPCEACLEAGPEGTSDPSARVGAPTGALEGPWPEIAALVGSLAANRIFAALLFDEGREGPFQRIEGGVGHPLPPCLHR